ncbi:MAG TPA: hypothetical protein VJ865_01860 [Gemmatimonadaceae bacterium]|nr:hypothetical protein [Gemmatimonadaceae bacterium]
MEQGGEFLRSQVRNVLQQHGTFLKSLEDHESQADDARFRDLCSRHIPHMRLHQRMLEEYQSQLGDEQNIGGRLLGSAISVVKDLADAAVSDDYNRLIGDIVMAHQSEDSFRTFREAGKILGNRTLQELGEIGERHHDAYAKEANRLVQQMFVEHVHGVDGTTPARVESRIDANA